MSFSSRNTQSLEERPRSGTVIGLRNTTTAEMFALDAGRKRWIVGSSDSADIVVDDPYVSRTHALVERRPSGTLTVKDQESRNGTFVEGNAVEMAELRVGSYISIGRSTLVAIAAPGEKHKRPALEQMLTCDPGLRKTIDQAVRAAQTDCSILVVGETGTGKDLLARIVHEASRRAGGAFVAVNCGAIPRELIGSELFGHERGSFTGAMESREGYFVAATDGTLFLDELGELPLELQPNLLRALEQKRIRRVGGAIERAVDVRIVAATNRIDGLGTDQGRLRVDLYHRLATVVLSIPPLRDRLPDVKLLVDAYLAEAEPEFGKKRISADGWAALTSYSWPGNVRELRGALARAVALGGNDLGPRDFFPDFAAPRRRSVLATPSLALPVVPGDPDAVFAPVTLDPHDPMAALLAPYEASLRAQMEDALAAHGSIRAAAEAIGMPKSTFADRAKAWGLLPRRKIRFGPAKPKA